MIGKNSMKHHYLSKEHIYSHLNMQDITDADYVHGKRFFLDFKIKTSGEYHDFYVQSVEKGTRGRIYHLFIDMQKLITNTRKIMIQIKNCQIFNTGMEIIYKDGQCCKSFQ